MVAQEAVPITRRVDEYFFTIVNRSLVVGRITTPVTVPNTRRVDIKEAFVGQYLLILAYVVLFFRC